MPVTSEDELLQALSELQTIAPASDQQKDILREIEEAARSRLSIWKDGIEPMPFDVFCEQLDGNALFPRQHAAFANSGMLSAYSIVRQDRALNEIVTMWGKGAGKDYIAAKFIAYLGYVVCHLTGYPAEHFGLARTTQMSVLNVAPSEDLARQVFFAPYLSVFVRSPLFEPFQPRITADSIFFDREDPVSGKPYTFLALLSKHSKSSGLDGYNLLGWVMDEADAFFDSAEKSNADAVHNILRSSCNTRMRNRWVGLVISYPRVEGGFMMRLYERGKKEMEAKGERSSFYVDRAATWEVNLRVSRDDPGIQADYDNDPGAAGALYECNPQATEQAFFEFSERVDQATDPQRQPAAYVEVKPHSVVLKTGNEDYFVTATITNIQRVPGYTYFLAGDAGRKQDSYALSLWHVDTQPAGFAYLCSSCGRDATLRTVAHYKLYERGAETEAKNVDEIPTCGCCGTPANPHRVNMRTGGGTYWLAGWWGKVARDESTITDSNGRTYNVAHIYEDLLIEVQPTRATRPGEKNRPVYMPGIQTLCEDIIRGFGVSMSRFDPWQTAQLTDGLKDKTGGDIDEMPFSNPEQYKRARLAKTLLYNGLITFLPNSRRDRQWKRLQLVGANKVDHPSGVGEGKDLFDVESMCIWMAATHLCGELKLNWT